MIRDDGEGQGEGGSLSGTGYSAGEYGFWDGGGLGSSACCVYETGDGQTEGEISERDCDLILYRWFDFTGACLEQLLFRGH